MAGAHFQHWQSSRVHTEFAEAGVTQRYGEIVYALRVERYLLFQ